ncbi:NfeD family protein [Aeromicrobium sp. NPDC092404]|uniref:NfeD family protein n=1 Tax=Aeromicrobium sp. NPDC092404 TaxID=3154976 RepID=UPI003441A3BF
MIDWIQDHPAASWLGVAVVLAVVEIFSLDLVLLMFALGAVAAAVASGFGAPLWLAIAVFAVVSVGFLYFVRPPVVARLHAGPTLTTGHEALVGRSGVVLEPVDKRNGRIQLAGEVWSARSAEEHHLFETGTEVLVTRIDGATAVVTIKES